MPPQFVNHFPVFSPVVCEFSCRNLRHLQTSTAAGLLAMTAGSASERRCSLQWGAFHESVASDARSIRVFTVVGLVMVVVGGCLVGVGLGNVGNDAWALWRLGLAGFVLGLALTLTSYWAARRRSRMLLSLGRHLAAASAIARTRDYPGDSHAGVSLTGDHRL